MTEEFNYLPFGITPLPKEPAKILILDGSIYIPYRVNSDGIAYFRPRRVLIDWNDPFGAPRRFYWFGQRFNWWVGWRQIGFQNVATGRHRVFTARIPLRGRGIDDH